jgi:hypothetical protein
MFALRAELLNVRVRAVAVLSQVQVQVQIIPALAVQVSVIAREFTCPAGASAVETARRSPSYRVRAGRELHS